MMEFIRERDQHRTTDQRDQLNATAEQPSELPPAPTPFPVELLQRHTESVDDSACTDHAEPFPESALIAEGALNPHSGPHGPILDRMTSHVRPQTPSRSASAHVHPIHLASVQSSCVLALRALLPGDDQAAVQALSPADSRLAAALTDMLEITYELEGVDEAPEYEEQVEVQSHSVGERSGGDEGRRDGEDGGSDGLSNLVEDLRQLRSSFDNLDQRIDQGSGQDDTLHPISASNGVKPSANHGIEVDYSRQARNNLDGSSAIRSLRESLALERLCVLSGALEELVRRRRDNSTSGKTIPGAEAAAGGECGGEAVMKSELMDEDTASSPPGYHEGSTLPAYQQTRSDDIFGSTDEKTDPKHDDKNGTEGDVEASTPLPEASVEAEKRMLELDDLTSAIERLGTAAPQYAQQRSTLRQRDPVRCDHQQFASSVRLHRSDDGAQRSKNGESSQTAQSRAKLGELEEIWKQIERAHGKRRMLNQDADLELVGRRRIEQREKYLQDLYDRAEASRMVNQDAAFTTVDAELAKAKELRRRDQFLRTLIDRSENLRLPNQDAVAPSDRQASFIDDIADRSAALRLSSQDYPTTVDEKMQERRDHLINELYKYSTSGRLDGQDAEMSVPRSTRESTLNLNSDPEPFDLSISKSHSRQRRASSVVNHHDAQGRHTPDNQQSPFDLITAEGFLKSLPPIDGDKHKSSIAKGAEDQETEKTQGQINGTFRKLKGMMRAKSISLGLKKGPVDDISSASFIAELQENLNIVTILVHGLTLPLPTDVTLQVKSMTQDAMSSEAVIQHGPSTTAIILPGPAQPGIVASFTPPVHSSSGLATHLETKISCLPALSSSSSASTPSGGLLGTKYPLSAADLRHLSPAALCCASCDRNIARLAPPEGSAKGFRKGKESGGRWKDLPSEHWAEMIEIWMCHQDPAWTSRLAKYTEEGFWPARGDVLVGGSFLLVHAEDGVKGNMKFGEGNDLAWGSIACICGEALGKARVQDGRPGAGTLRLAKWAVGLLREDEDESDSVESPFTTFIAADMLELAQAHASFRFAIRDEETDEKRILIWLFQPSVRITYRKSSLSPTPSPFRQSFAPPVASSRPNTSRRSSLASTRSIGSASNADLIDRGREVQLGSTQQARVCKVMYRVLEKGEQIRLPGFGPISTSNGKDGVNSASPQMQVEDLRYPSQICERLVRALRQSTEVYPGACRRMGPWDVGFLQRE